MQATDPVVISHTDTWTIVASIAAASSAVFAGIQVLLSRRDANRRAALELLRDLESKSRDLISISVADAQDCILAMYRGSPAEVTSGVKAYFAFLNSADLASFAVAKGLADRELLDEHISTLLRAEVITLAFLTALQEACRDDKVYEHLHAQLHKHQLRGVARQPPSR